jgi:hypothetical protein
VTAADHPPRDTALLAGIAILAAVPMVSMAASHRLDFDSWWHVFIAREYPWPRFWRDVAHNVHPPVFYLLLRAVSQLGSERLIYRAISILAAVVATYAVGRIAQRVLRTPRLALLCALAFGLAMPTVVMASAVRSYMLSLALMLIAFRVYLDLIDPQHGRPRARAPMRFVAALVGAMFTHYAAIFLAGAMLVLPGLYAVVDGRYRRWLGNRLRTGWRPLVVSIAAIAAVVAVLYLAHFSRWGTPMRFAAEFYPAAQESAAAFLNRAVVAEFDLFSPKSIGSLPTVGRSAALGVLLATAGGLLFALRRRANWVVAAAPLATLVIVTVLIAAASLAGRYPFGGFLRHQFILFPFIVLGAFGLIDELLAGRRRQRLALAALGAGLVLNGLIQWRRMPRISDEPGAQQFARFVDALGASPAVYVDHFSLIHLFANQQRREWAPQSAAGEDFFLLPVVGPQRTLPVYRDMTRWSSDLSDPELYRDLRRLLERTQPPSIDLFRLQHDSDTPAPLPRLERAQRAESIIALARSEGLRVGHLVLDGFHVYARLQLEPSDAVPHHGTPHGRSAAEQ